MRALQYDRYGSADVLAIVDIDDPVPRAGELKVAVNAASLNPIDVKLRAGHMRLVPGFDRPPRGCGLDFAGVVVGTGGGAVDGYFPGARVFGTLSPFRRAGAFADFVCVTPDRLAPTPDAIPDAAAAALPIAAGTAVQAFADHVRLAGGMRVLVNGAAGGVGHYAVQYARHVGAHVTATCGPDNLAFVASLGAEVVLDYTREDFTEGTATWDVILDAAASTNWRRCRNVLAPDGVYLNTCADARSVMTTLAESAFARFGGNQRAVALALRGGAQAWRRLAGLAEAGAFVPHVRATVGLAEVADAQRQIERGHGRGKVVVEPAR